MGDLVRKNRNVWQEKYKEEAEKITDAIKEKIYAD